MKAAPRLPENKDGSSYLYISLNDPTPKLLNLRKAHAANQRTGFSSASLQVPFGEKRSVTHIKPELQAQHARRMDGMNERHRVGFEATDVAAGRSVTAPSDALLTEREYFAKAPRRA